MIFFQLTRSGIRRRISRTMTKGAHVKDQGERIEHKVDKLTMAVERMSTNFSNMNENGLVYCRKVKKIRTERNIALMTIGAISFSGICSVLLGWYLNA